MGDIAPSAITAIGTVCSALIAGIVLLRVNLVHKVVNSNHAAALARIQALEALLAMSRDAQIVVLQEALRKAEGEAVARPPMTPTTPGVAEGLSKAADGLIDAANSVKEKTE